MSAEIDLKSPAKDCGCDPYLLSLVESKELQVKKTKSSTGLFLAGATGLTAIGISALCFPFVAPALRRICLPYVPASTNQVENVIKALTRSKAKGRLIDLGSGDGRIVRFKMHPLRELFNRLILCPAQVFAAAQNGFQSHGVELNRVLVFFSKIKAMKDGLRNATFSRQDLFKVNYSNYDNVVIFGVNEMVNLY